MDKKRISEVLSRIFHSNGKFVVAFVLFAIWMLFFDGNRISNQMKLSKKSEQFKSDIELYKEKIIKAKADKIDLEVNKEKYAREKYYLHHPDEDVFIINKEKNKQEKK